MKVRKVKFNDVVDGQEGLLKGPFGSDLKKTLYVPKGIDTYKVYLQENILKKDISKGKHYISKDYFDNNMKRYEVKEGDFIVTCDGTLGEIFQLIGLKEKGIISSSLLRITLNPKIINHNYFPYLWKQRIKYPLIRSHENSVLKHLPGLNAIRNFEFEIPELGTQKKIGSILSNLDSKIELNNCINEELEAMAKIIYDYWFVQFDFPDINGKPYKSSGGKMVWNEELKREIPEGWENGIFANYCPSTGGFAFKSNWWTDEGVAVAKIKDIQENYTLDTSDLARVEISDKEIDDKFLAKAGDILIAMTGATVGKYAIVPITDYPIYVNQRVGYFNLGNNPIKRLPFLINSMNQSYFRNSIFTLANGAAQPNISNEQINSVQLLMPGKMLIDKYNEIFYPYYKTILNNQSENQQLTSLRDWLLPMLMNGQVKIQ